MPKRVAPALLPTGLRLREVLRYNPLTGSVTWLVGMGSRAAAGTEVGGPTSEGYLCVGLDGRLMQLHRVIWCWMTNEWPAGDVDHRDGDRTNNRWTNLRDANALINAENHKHARSDSRTGVQGVGLTKANAKRPGFRAGIRSRGRHFSLGVYDTMEQARAIYVAAKLVLHAGWVPPPDVSASAALRAEVGAAASRRARRDNGLGLRGVQPHGSRFRVRYRKKHLGLFDTVEEAVAAYEQARTPKR